MKTTKRMLRTKKPKRRTCMRRIHRLPKAAGASRCSARRPSKKTHHCGRERRALRGIGGCVSRGTLSYGEGLGSQWELCGAGGGDKGSILQAPLARYDMVASPKIVHPFCTLFPLPYAASNILSTSSPKLCDIPLPVDACFSCELALINLHFQRCCIRFEPDDVHVDTRLCTRTSAR
jgi:hypothetical protein